MKTMHSQFLGTGLEWSTGIDQELLENLDQVDAVELIPENFFLEKRRHTIDVLAERQTPVLLHGVELSLGSDEPLKQQHLDQILALADRLNIVNISDHLCMTECGGVEIGQLTTIPFTSEMAEKVAEKITKVKNQLPCPFLIENITNPFIWEGNSLEETAFINQVLTRADCQLLLDVTNVYTNSYNFGFDPYAWIDAIDHHRVATIHLAGGYHDEEGELIDGHSHAIPQEVWDLFGHVVKKGRPPLTIVERTSDWPSLDVLLAETLRAKEMIHRQWPQTRDLRFCPPKKFAISETNLEHP